VVVPQFYGGDAMIKALNIAAQGMVQAESRATDVAVRILGGTAENNSSFSNTLASGKTLTDTATPPKSGAPVAVGYTSLIQDAVDMKAATLGFQANAKVFVRINQMMDETLGTLLDNKS